MLSVLSPAKSLDYESPLATKTFSQPILLDHAAELVELLATKPPEEIGRLMSISDNLAELNAERYSDWQRPFTPDNARPALLAFKGDVYVGMDAANTFGDDDFDRSQRTLRILSGLYGLLRPLDLMQPYRLEMGTKLVTSRGKNLYGFWGTTITDELNNALTESPGEDVLVNLASNEYFSSVVTEQVNAAIVSPRFLDRKPGADYKVVSFHAKKARGAMAGWLIQNRIETVDEFAHFDRLGYAFDAEQSTPNEPVFLRTNE